MRASQYKACAPANLSFKPNGPVGWLHACSKQPPSNKPAIGLTQTLAGTPQAVVSMPSVVDARNLGCRFTSTRNPSQWAEPER